MIKKAVALQILILLRFACFAQEVVKSELYLTDSTISGLSTLEAVRNYHGNLDFKMPKDFNDGVIKEYINDPNQKVYYDSISKSSKYDSTLYNSNHIHGVNQKTRSAFYLLFYSDRKNTRRVILDKNFDLDFSNDSVMIVRAGEPLKIQIDLEFVFLKEIHREKLEIKLDCYSQNFTFKDSLENKWPMSISNRLCYLSKFRYQNESYSVEFRVGPIKNLFNPNGFRINVSDPDSNISIPDHLRIFEYRIKKDSILKRNKVFVCDSIDLRNNEAFWLCKRRLDKHGIMVNDEISNFKLVSPVSNKPFYINNSQSKFTLLDFWGSWCGPCLRNIPGLKALEGKYTSSQLRIISVAKEYNKTNNKLLKIIKENDLNWEHSVVNSLTSEDNIISDLHIMSYPTYILVDEKNIILFRETGEEGLAKISAFLGLHL